MLSRRSDVTFRQCTAIRRSRHVHTTRTTKMIRGFPNNFGGAGGGPNRETAFDVLDYPCDFTFKVIGER